jgi:WD repeat-containing protein 76
LLEELELDANVDESLGIPQKPTPTSTKAKPIQPTLKRKREAAEALPPRRSTRNKFVADPNETPAQRKRREVQLIHVYEDI